MYFTPEDLDELQDRDRADAEAAAIFKMRRDDALAAAGDPAPRRRGAGLPDAVNEWHNSRNGNLRIRLYDTYTAFRCWDVYAIPTGTHDVIYSRTFESEAEARDYANQLWALPYEGLRSA